MKRDSANFLGTDDFWVVSCFFNPLGLRNKIDNFLVFSERIRLQGAKLMVVELSVNDAPFVINENSCDKLIRVKSNSCLWHKEALLNIAIKHIPDHGCSAFVDADMIFQDGNWVEKTINALKVFPVVQPYSKLVKLTEEETKQVTLTDEIKYASSPIDGCVFGFANKIKMHTYNTGGAVAFRNEIIKKVGFYPYAVIGGGDSIMARALFSVPSNYLQIYLKYGKKMKEHSLKWIENARKITNQKNGCVEGTILHLWHGQQKNRNYGTRFFPLKLLGFDPLKDVLMNKDEVLEWNTASLRAKLESKIVYLYFLSRQEEKTGLVERLISPILFKYPGVITQKVSLLKNKLFFNPEKNHLKVLFITFWELNPYHKMLAQELEKSGFSVYGKLMWKPNLCYPTQFLFSDILHVHATVFASTRLQNIIATTYYIIGLSVSKLLGKRIIFTLHNLVPLDNKSRITNRLFVIYLSLIADKIIIHHKAGMDEAIKKLSLNTKKVILLPHPNYVDCYKNNSSTSESRLKLGLKDDSFVFLFFGLLRKYKGLDELVDSFMTLPDKNAVLVIAGKPSCGFDIRPIKEKIKNDPRIILVSKAIPADDVQYYFNSANALVLSYNKTSFTSGAALLGMSFKKAIIAPRTNFFDSTLKKQNRLIYSDINQLRNKMAFALRNKKYLQTAGDKNLKECLRYGWKEFANETKKAYLGK